MNPVVDRTIIVFVSGMILSGLEMGGYVDPNQHTQTDQTIQAAVGGVIAIVTIAGFLMHHASVTKARIAAGEASQPLTSPIKLASLINWLKQFIFRAPPVVAGDGAGGSSDQSPLPVTTDNGI